MAEKKQNLLKGLLFETVTCQETFGNVKPQKADNRSEHLLTQTLSSFREVAVYFEVREKALQLTLLQLKSYNNTVPLKKTVDLICQTAGKLMHDHQPPPTSNEETDIKISWHRHSAKYVDQAETH